jgi:hypothetical protein
MNNKKQILIAFFVPFILAVCLLFLRVFVYCNPDFECTGDRQSISFVEYYNTPLLFDALILFSIAMFALSLILPPFVMMRTYQSRRNKLESPSIFE